MNPVEVVLANNDRVTLRVGDVFLKVDSNRARADIEATAMEAAPVPTAEILWHEPPVLALAALSGRPLGRLGEPSTASQRAWSAVGRTLRSLHDGPLPDWTGTRFERLEERLDDACRWFEQHDVVTVDVLAHNRRLAERILRPWTPSFVHGDLHIEHVFVDGDDVTGIIDWSEACQGDALFDIASLTLANEGRLDDLLDGYGTDVDRDVISAWWSFRSLVVVPWLFDNGYGPPDEYPEVAVLRSQAGASPR